MKIFGITGLPLSGKTLAAEMMENHGYTIVDMGDVVRIEMDKREIDTSQTKEFVNGLREEHGMNAIAKLTKPYLEEIIAEKEKIVITGMRSIEEKRYFEQQTGRKIKTIAIWSTKEKRKERKKERQREEDLKGQKFDERDKREIENGVANLMALSDYLIKNNYDKKEKLKQKIEKNIIEA